jgi:GNAT superfamily N-acetyltransferase
MQVVGFERRHVQEAAALFVASLEALRAEVPALSGVLADRARVEAELSRMRGVAAIEDGRLVGYLTSWFPIASFRGTQRAGAYVPGWAHQVRHGAPAEVVALLYRAACDAWIEAGCSVHAITLLANDHASLDAWFRLGFGMGTIDAVRPMEPLGLRPPDGFMVRSAADGDATALADLDAEHVRHYGEPPVLMVPPRALDADGWRAFLDEPLNTAWLAEDPDGPFGFLRFDRAFDGSDVIETDDGVFIGGAYVRASHRRLGVASAILDAALRHYAAIGLRCCALDYESFNPEAAAFWPRYFTPVCHSLLRVPEFGGAV